MAIVPICSIPNCESASRNVLLGLTRLILPKRPCTACPQLSDGFRPTPFRDYFCVYRSVEARTNQRHVRCMHLCGACSSYELSGKALEGFHHQTLLGQIAGPLSTSSSSGRVSQATSKQRHVQQLSPGSGEYSHNVKVELPNNTGTPLGVTTLKLARRNLFSNSVILLKQQEMCPMLSDKGELAWAHARTTSPGPYSLS